VSKERARRRAEREAEAARKAEARRIGAEREARRRARWRRLRGRLPRLAPGPAARRRRRRGAAAAAVFLAVQGAAWLLGLEPMARFGVLVVSVLVFPIGLFLLFDRR
jgi:Flp pilus assembly protein TadB